MESGKIAGSIAAEAVLQNNFSKKFLRNYELMWKRAFGSLIKAGLIFRDILYFALRKGIAEKVFNAPSDEELKQLLLDGKAPLRARIFWLITRLPWN